MDIIKIDFNKSRWTNEKAIRFVKKLGFEDLVGRHNKAKYKGDYLSYVFIREEEEQKKYITHKHPITADKTVIITFIIKDVIIT